MQEKRNRIPLAFIPKMLQPHQCCSHLNPLFMRHFLILFFAFLCCQSLNAQLPHRDTFRHNGTETHFLAEKDGNKYSVQINTEPKVKSASNDPNPFAFFRKTVSERLMREFSDQPSENERLAIRFAKAATAVQPTVGRIRSKRIGDFEIVEFQTATGDYLYSKVDASGIAASADFFSKNGARYQYSSAVLNADNFLKDNLATIQDFLKENKNIDVPAIEANVSTANSDELLIKYAMGTPQHVPATAAQIKPFSKTTSGNLTLANGATTASAVKTTENKKPQRLLDPQSIACAGKNIFELTPYTYPDFESSLLIEINTKTGKMWDTLDKQIGSVAFQRRIKNDSLVKRLSCTDSVTDSALNVFYVGLNEMLKAKKKEEEKKALDDTIRKMVNAVIDTTGNRFAKIANEKGFAARLVLKDSLIPLNVSCKDKHQTQNKFVNAEMLKLDSIVIQVNNNLIYQIDIVGRLGDKKIQTISNDQYGLSLRELIDWSSGIKFYEEGKEYCICYRNLVFVRPADEDAINYTIADGAYVLVPQRQPSQLLAQKPLMDFVSASAFLDLQAFNEKNPNRNLLTELYFDFPINNHRFWLKSSWFRHLYTNLTLSANLFKESNTLPTYRDRQLIYRDSSRIDTATRPPFYKYDSLFNNKYYLKHFDLVRYAFFQAKPTLNIFSIDYKEARSFFEFNTGLLLMGSNVRVTDPNLGKDSITSTPVYSFGHLWELRGRISPKPRFGIDMHLTYVPKLRLLNSTYEAITGPYDAETLVKAKMTNENLCGFVQGEINFFFNPRESPSPTDRSGLYFKLNMYKATKKPDGFFMFLVGYSTDIKNFFR